jgi:uncharacterized membrane protein
VTPRQPDGRSDLDRMPALDGRRSCNDSRRRDGEHVGMTSCPTCGAILQGAAGCPTCGPVRTGFERWTAALAYFWITGIVFLFAARRRANPYVRFHCLQAVFYGAVVLLMNAVLAIVAVQIGTMGAFPIIYATVWGVIRIGLFLLWILGMLKAYEGIEYKLPWVGNLARKYVPARRA